MFQPVALINQTIELAKPGQIFNSKTEIPFQVLLKGRPNKPLYETYHGVFINIQVKWNFFAVFSLIVFPPFSIFFVPILNEHSFQKI